MKKYILIYAILFLPTMALSEVCQKFDDNLNLIEIDCKTKQIIKKYEEPKYEEPKYKGPICQDFDENLNPIEIDCKTKKIIKKYEKPKYKEPKYEELKYKAPKHKGSICQDFDENLNPIEIDCKTKQIIKKYEEPKYEELKYKEPEHKGPICQDFDENLFSIEIDCKTKKIIKKNKSVDKKSRFYLGVDIASIDMDDLHENTKRFGIIFGYDFNKYLGGELFYNKIGARTYEDYEYNYMESIYTRRNIKSKNIFGFDLSVKIPLSSSISMLVLPGFDFYQYNVDYRSNYFYYGYIPYSYTDEYNIDNSSIRLRLGAGFQYEITDDFSIRGICRHISLLKKNELYTGESLIPVGLTEVSIGIKYSF